METLDDVFEKYSKHPLFPDADSLTVNSVAYDGDSILHFSCLNNNAEEARILIENGASVNLAGDMGLTPLHWAVEHSDLEIVKLLVEAGADPFIADEFGDDCIARAKFCKNIAAVKFLESLPRHPNA